MWFDSFSIITPHSFTLLSILSSFGFRPGPLSIEPFFHFILLASLYLLPLLITFSTSAMYSSILFATVFASQTLAYGLTPSGSTVGRYAVCGYSS